MVESIAALPLTRAFDDASPGYDAAFAHRPTGRLLRDLVWRHLTRHLRPGMGVLDLGCGTGEDAVRLARMGCVVTATDGAPAMLRATESKAQHNGVADRIVTRLIDLNAPGDIGGPFDFVLSNFGALNCAVDLTPVAAALRAAVAPGGVVAAVAMGRFCAWETLWYGVRLRAAAVRRWRGVAEAAIGDRIIPIRYWRVRDLAKSLGPAFHVLSIRPIGLFLPPSAQFSFVEGRPRLLASLARCEERISSISALAGLADHHLTVVQRVRESGTP